MDPIERFDLLELVGKGGYASVYQAYDNVDSHFVAIKRVNLDEAADEMDEVQKEIDFMKNLNCPQLVKYHASYIVENELWIVMEYMDCGSLLDVINNFGPLAEEFIPYVIRELLLALQYLHSRNIIHRDVKAGNLLVAANGTIHLADFGVTGQITDMTTKRNTKIGTPFWMAPEVIMELPYDGCADIWGLGITAMELAKGLPPYAGKYSSWQVTLLIPKNNPPVLEGEFSELFKDFVASCLVKEPEQRPSASVLLEHPFIAQAAVASPAWQQFLVDRVLPTRPNSNGHRTLTSITASGDSNISQDNNANNANNRANMHKRSGSGWDFEDSLHRSSSHHRKGTGGGRNGPSRSVSRALGESSGSSFHGTYPSLPGTTVRQLSGDNAAQIALTMETRSLSHSILGSGSDSSLTESGHPLASSNSAVDNEYDVTPNKSRLLRGISGSASVTNNNASLNTASRDLLYDSSDDNANHDKRTTDLPVFSDSEGSTGYEKKGLRRAVSTGSYSSSSQKQRRHADSDNEAYNKTMPASSSHSHSQDDDDDSLFSPPQSSANLIAGLSLNLGMMNHKAIVLQHDEMTMPTPRFNVPPPARHHSSSGSKKHVTPVSNISSLSINSSLKEKKLADEITRLKAELKQAKEEILRLRTISKPYLSALSLLNKRHKYNANSPTATAGILQSKAGGAAEEKRSSLPRALSSNSLRDWTSVLSVSTDEDEDDNEEKDLDEYHRDNNPKINKSLSQKQQPRPAEFTLNTPESSQIISRQVLPPKAPITPASSVSRGGGGGGVFDNRGQSSRNNRGGEEEAESKTNNDDDPDRDPHVSRQSFRRSKSDHSSAGASSSGGQSSHFDLAALLPITSSVTNNSSSSTLNYATSESSGLQVQQQLKCSEALKRIVQPSLMALKDNFMAGRYGTQESSGKWEDAWLLLATAFSALDALSTSESEGSEGGSEVEKREPMIDLVSLISSFTVQELELPQEPIL